MRWRKKREEEVQPHADLDEEEDEMTVRAAQALQATIDASALAQQHAEEAQRLFGTIRREIAVAQARPKPKGKAT